MGFFAWNSAIFIHTLTLTLRRSLIRKVSTWIVQLRQLRSLLEYTDLGSIATDGSQIVHNNIYSDIVEHETLSSLEIVFAIATVKKEAE